MLFHLSVPGLPAGHVIEPGRWGDIIGGTPGHQYDGMEVRFELSRQTIAPELPSRLACTYAFDDQHAMTRFRQVRPMDALYEVELVNPDAKVHRANYLLIFPGLGTDPARPHWTLTTSEYWKPTTPARPFAYDYEPELLIDGPLRIVRFLDAPL